MGKIEATLHSSATLTIKEVAMLKPKLPQDSFFMSGSYLYDRIIPQDHLTGTAITSDTSGSQIGSIKYYPYGSTRSSSGTLPDQKFTGQRLDDTGLYYYNARYYDAGIGRFISADTIVPSFVNPQNLNRYSYCLSNPLKYIDPTGHKVDFIVDGISILALLRDPYLIFGGAFWKSEMGQKAAALLVAWALVDKEAPKLTGYLEKRPETVNIMFRDFKSKTRRGETAVYGKTIFLANTLRSDLNWMASILAHEAMHSAFRLSLKGVFFSNSYAEEAFAYSLQYHVAEKLTGAKPLNKYAVACKDFHPDLTVDEMEKQITGDTGIRHILQESEAYSGAGYLWGHAIWPTGFAWFPAKTLIETAKACWP